MEDSEKGPANLEFLDEWFSYFHELDSFCKRQRALNEELDKKLRPWVVPKGRIRHLPISDSKNKVMLMEG
jgi:hypothetical protein